MYGRHPVGYEQGSDGVIKLTDFGALLTNPTLVFAMPHLIFAALMTGGFVMAGISAWHLLRRNADRDFFRKSLRLGVVVAFLGTFVTIGFGFAQFAPLGEVQPIKFGNEADRDAAVQDFVTRFGPDEYLPPSYSTAGLGLMITLGMLLLAVHGRAFLGHRWPVLGATSVLIAAVTLWAGSRVDWIPGGSSVVPIVAYTVIPVVIAVQVTIWWLFRSTLGRSSTATRPVPQAGS